MDFLPEHLYYYFNDAVSPQSYAYANLAGAGSYSLTTVCYLGQVYVTDYDAYQLFRAALGFDTAPLRKFSLSSATFQFDAAYEGVDIEICLVSYGRVITVFWPSINGYWELGFCKEVFGSVVVTGGGTYQIPLNAAGVTYINKTGKTNFALRSREDIDRLWTGDRTCNTNPYTMKLTVETEVSPIAGHIWEENNEIHYIDKSTWTYGEWAGGVRRAFDGTVGALTGKKPGHLWIPTSQVKFIGDDGADQAKEGTLTAVTATKAGFISIPDTKKHYIDFAKDERTIEGDLV